jgi:citrate lyase beta subunit
MKTTISPDFLRSVASRLERAGESPLSRRLPVHTIYGGAQLFTSETPTKLGLIARKALDQFAPDESSFSNIFGMTHDLAADVRARVGAKLSNDPVEDLRIDFEDGYGVRTGEEEDGHAISAADETAKAMAADGLPTFFGIRIKALNSATGERAIRTLDLYLTRLVGAADGRPPDNFVVTLPKVCGPGEVSLLVSVLEELESASKLVRGSIGIEIMVETTRSLIAADGTFALGRIVEAAAGRCVAAHFGAYDYLSELGVTASDQMLNHKACDLARGIMKLSLAGTEVDLADGATNLMPVARHRGAELSGEQSAENMAAVRSAWKLHYDNIRHALVNGFYRGWDLHPAQMVARYAAVYAYFLESAAESSERLRNFIDKGARATLVGNNFDDAATGQGLLNYFRRAIDCGAMSADEVQQATGLTSDDIRISTFAQLIENKGSK